MWSAITFCWMTSVVNRHLQLTRAAFGLLLSLWLVACSLEQPAHKFSGPTMGTRYHVTVVDPERRFDPEKLQEAVDQRLEAVNQSMSTYIQDSELNQLNRTAVGDWQPVSHDLFEVLFTAMQVSWLSAGAFDVTVGPLVNLWGFGPEQRPEQVPSDTEIEAVRKNIGFNHIELDLAGRQAKRTREVNIDLSAIAKGYGVDAVAALLESAGIEHYMVEIGGELRLKGLNPQGQPWRIGVEEPKATAQGEPYRALRLTDVGVATSGDYRNYFEVEGQRYSHTVDPTTGRPIRHRLASVTVVADSSMLADALATAINVLGPERGYRLAEQQGVAAFLVSKRPDGEGFESRYTPAFAQYLEQSGEE